jgi:hypothetical protein
LIIDPKERPNAKDLLNDPFILKKVYISTIDLRQNKEITFVKFFTEIVQP